MRILKPIAVFKLIYHKRNEDIRKELKIIEKNTELKEINGNGWNEYGAHRIVQRQRR